jgi:hypothetical protein
MDKIVAHFLKDVNGVSFGTKRKAVRAVFGTAKEYKKNKFSETITDDFGFCHVFYNAEDECEAIEVFGDIKVEVDGAVIFPTDVETAKKQLSDLVEEDGSLISKKFSVGIYAPSGKMESILFGAPGYYD